MANARPLRHYFWGIAGLPVKLNMSLPILLASGQTLAHKCFMRKCLSRFAVCDVLPSTLTNGGNLPTSCGQRA